MDRATNISYTSKCGELTIIGRLWHVFVKRFYDAAMADTLVYNLYSMWEEGDEEFDKKYPNAPTSFAGDGRKLGLAPNLPLSNASMVLGLTPNLPLSNTPEVFEALQRIREDLEYALVEQVITEVVVLIHSDEVSGMTVYSNGAMAYWTEGRGSEVVIMNSDGSRETTSWAPEAKHWIWDVEECRARGPLDSRQMTKDEERSWENMRG